MLPTKLPCHPPRSWRLLQEEDGNGAIARPEPCREEPEEDSRPLSQQSTGQSPSTAGLPYGHEQHLTAGQPGLPPDVTPKPLQITRVLCTLGSHAPEQTGWPRTRRRFVGTDSNDQAPLTHGYRLPQLRHTLSTPARSASALLLPARRLLVPRPQHTSHHPARLGHVFPLLNHPCNHPLSPSFLSFSFLEPAVRTQHKNFLREGEKRSLTTRDTALRTQLHGTHLSRGSPGTPVNYSEVTHGLNRLQLSPLLSDHEQRGGRKSHLLPGTLCCLGYAALH